MPLSALRRVTNQTHFLSHKKTAEGFLNFSFAPRMMPFHVSTLWTREKNKRETNEDNATLLSQQYCQPSKLLRPMCVFSLVLCPRLIWGRDRNEDVCVRVRTTSWESSRKFYTIKKVAVILMNNLSEQYHGSDRKVRWRCRIKQKKNRRAI